MSQRQRCPRRREAYLRMPFRGLQSLLRGSSLGKRGRRQVSIKWVVRISAASIICQLGHQLPLHFGPHHSQKWSWWPPGCPLGYLAWGGVSRLPRTLELNTEQREAPSRASSCGAPQVMPPEAALATLSCWRLCGTLGLTHGGGLCRKVTEGSPNIDQCTAHDTHGLTHCR